MRTATPEDVNMLPGAHLPPFIPKEENLVSPNAEEARLRELEAQKVPPCVCFWVGGLFFDPSSSS